MTVHSNRQHKGLFRLLTVAVFMIAVVALVSCLDKQGIDKDTVTIYPIDINTQIETQVSTRAGAVDYIPYTGHRQIVHAEAVTNDAQHTTVEGWFEPNKLQEGRWSSVLNLTSGKQYYLYCYTAMPINEAERGLPTFTFTSESNVTLTFDNFEIITTIDPLVSAASIGRLLPDHEFLDPATDYPHFTDQSFGKYDIGIIQSGTDQQGHATSTKVFLALDHLFAKATMSFKVDNDYNNIRTIKLKEAKISTTNGQFTGTYIYSFADRNFALAGNATAQYTASPLDIDLIEVAQKNNESLLDQNQMVVLDNNYKELGWFCLLPRNDLPALDLTVKYNVYDKNGKLIRENQEVTNSNLIKINNPEKGKNYNIKVNVAPTYLYQLSDEDVALELTLE